MEKVVKKKRKELIKAVGSLIFKVLLLTASIGWLPISETFFNFFLGVANIIYAFCVIILVISAKVVPKDKLLEAMKLKERFVMATTTVTKINLIASQCVIIAIVLKFLGYSSYSWAFVNWEILTFILHLSFYGTTIAIIHMCDTTIKELLILSYMNDFEYRKIVNEYLAIKDSFILDGGNTKIVKKELFEVQKMYLNLLQ